MAKVFNVSGACRPAEHYMVDLGSRLEAIKSMVDLGEYFAINKARQYGKTTILRALAAYLERDHVVISLDFQRMSSSDFVNESAFVNGLAREVEKVIRRGTEISDWPKDKIKELACDKSSNLKMAEIFECFSEWCGQSEKPVVLIIDEVDTASNNQVFLDFLAQLRAYYLDRDVTPIFQSVILAGVYDVRNRKRKIRPEDEHKQNSPWNIAADFEVEMGFSPADIAGMLDQYEEDARRYFMLYLKPIINGTGNFYVESRTRNQERTDLIVDYKGCQYIVEMKIWRGNSYNERGEEQLSGYLDHYHLKAGYMLSFNFNRKKETGLKKIQLGDKVLIEAVV